MVTWQYHPLLVVFQLGGLISIGVAAFCLRYGRKHGFSALVAGVGLLAFHNAVWNLAASVKVASPTLGQKLLFYKLEYLGSGVNPSVALVIALAYLGYERWLSRTSVAGLAAVPVVTVPLILINPADLMIVEPTLVRVGEIYALEHEFTLAFSLFLAWALGATLLAGLLIGHGAAVGSVPRKPATLIALALLLPVAVVWLKVAGIYPPGGDGINVTPAVNTLSLAMVAVAIGRYRLFDLLPIGRDRAIEVMRDGYVLVDPNDRIVDANAAARELLGQSTDGSLVGRSAADVVPVYADLSAADGTITFSNGDRAVQAVSSRVASGNRPVGRVVVLRDVTELKDRERELERYERIIENLPVGVYRMTPDPDGEIAFANRALVELFGAGSKAELYRRTPGELFENPRVSEDAGSDLLDRAVLGDEEFRVRTLDGEERWVSVSDRPVDLDGRAYVEGTVQDITERKAYERDLERKNDHLEEFAGIVSHDLRNPLNVASGHLDLARDDCGSDHLAAVDSALERMERLVRDLLILARQGKTIETDEMAVVDLPELACACWSGVRTADATLDVAATHRVVAVEARLRQLLENLVRNAIEHGGDDVTVRIGDLEDGFYVEDDGPGVPESEHGQVFDPGYSTRDDGTGLGLSIVDEIAEAHGWRLSLAEAASGGARVEVTGVEVER